MILLDDSLARWSPYFATGWSLCLIHYDLTHPGWPGFPSWEVQGVLQLCMTAGRLLQVRDGGLGRRQFERGTDM